MPWATVRAIRTVRAAIAHGAVATILTRTGVRISGARVAAQHPWRRRRQRRQRRHDPRSAVEAVGAKDTLFIRDGSRTSIFAYSVAPIVVIRVHVAILSVREIAVIRAKHPRRRTWKRGGRGWRRRRQWVWRRRRRRRRNDPRSAVDAVGAKRTLDIIVVVLGAWPAVFTDASTAISVAETIITGIHL